MSYEVEQKYRVTGFRQIVERLAKLGATLGEPIEQVDTYYAHPSRDFGETDEAFRLRRTGTMICMTYKGPRIDANTKTRKEIEIPLAPGTDHHRQCRAMLKALGFRLVAEVRKMRRVASWTDQGFPIEVAVDEVRDVGKFVEIETSADAKRLASAKDRIAKVAGQLGLTQSERTSYLELLLRSRQRQK